VNILFVNHGDFRTNSINHIAPFATRLYELGHNCTVAVPERPETAADLPGRSFGTACFAEVLARGSVFADGNPADLIHCWTPREIIRDFAIQCLRKHPARLVVHLEDNELHISSLYAGKSINQLAVLTDSELSAALPRHLSHPIRHRSFLRMATGITVITPRLAELVPDNRPAHLLCPGLDFLELPPRHTSVNLRRELGISAQEKVIVYPGALSFATADGICSLIGAIRLLNSRNATCKLIRTGPPNPAHSAKITEQLGPLFLDLGYVSRNRIAALLSIADVLIQPGTTDDFNDYRLPSKVPEFLASGRPVILPATNIGAELTDGLNALLLRTGTSEEIAQRCQEVFNNPHLAERLGAAGRKFALERFDLKSNTAKLLDFYLSTGSLPPVTLPPYHDDDTTLAETVACKAAGGTPTPGSAAADLVHRVAELARRSADFETERAATTAKLASITAELEAARAKLSRMQHSFSWQATAPLRALRRLLIDRFTRPR
jgi:glycosyltransferase involved in cell wall biosynthesis